MLEEISESLYVFVFIDVYPVFLKTKFPLFGSTKIGIDPFDPKTADASQDGDDIDQFISERVGPNFINPPNPFDEEDAKEEMIGIILPYANFVCVSSTVNVADAVLIIVNE